MDVSIQYKKLHEDAELPIRSDPEAIGLDLSAFSIADSGHKMQIILPPRVTKVIRTGLVFLPPPNYFLTVCSRSGLASNSLFVANSPGIIDPNYTGELKVLLFNGGHDSVYIRHGERIAQLVCLPLPPKFGLNEVLELPATSRGDRGIGSSGTKPIP